MTKAPSTAHFVLVHGACHGRWCWYKIRCLLESTGHKVSCPDLSSSGIDPSDANTIFTFQDYNKPLDDILSSLPKDEKVILVGHSAGGHSITEAIQNFPEKIQVAIFVGATMLRNGFQTQQDRKDGAPNLSRYGELYDYGYGEGRDNPPTSVIFKKEVQREILYQMSPLEDCTLATMLLRPCPVRVFDTAVFPEGLKTGPYCRSLSPILASTRIYTVGGNNKESSQMRAGPCNHQNHNLTIRVEEASKRPYYLVIKTLYQGGQTNIIGVHIAAVGSRHWTSTRKSYGAVWDTIKLLTGPLKLRFLVKLGFNNNKTCYETQKVLPSDWKFGQLYDAGIQIQDIAQEKCHQYDEYTW